MLGIDELLEISTIVQDAINDHLEEILVKLNRSEQLEEFLSLIGMNDLIGKTRNVSTSTDGIIIVIGQSEVEKEKLAAVAKSLGIDKNRFEFCLSYEDAKAYNFRKTQWSNAYSVIMVGEMPHSGKAKGDYGSIISALERQDGYPPVVRVGTNGLNITKTSFRTSLEYLLEKKIIS